MDLYIDSQILTHNSKLFFSQAKAPIPFHDIQDPSPFGPHLTFHPLSILISQPSPVTLKALNAPVTNNSQHSWRAYPVRGTTDTSSLYPYHSIISTLGLLNRILTGGPVSSLPSVQSSQSDPFKAEVRTRYFLCKMFQWLPNKQQNPLF